MGTSNAHAFSHLKGHNMKVFTVIAAAQGENSMQHYIAVIETDNIAAYIPQLLADLNNMQTPDPLAEGESWNMIAVFAGNHENLL